MERLSPRAWMRIAGGVLLLAGLGLTHTLRLIGDLLSEVGSWATGFVFNPFVWFGVIIGAIGLGLLLLAGRLPGKALPPAPEAKQVEGKGDDVDDILKKYGIS
jgi:hypothetical protein